MSRNAGFCYNSILPVFGEKGDQKNKTGNKKEHAAYKADHVPAAETCDPIKNCRGNKEYPSPELTDTIDIFLFFDHVPTFFSNVKKIIPALMIQGRNSFRGINIGACFEVSFEVRFLLPLKL